MGPNHIIDNFMQPSTTKCCCGGQYCNSSLNMERKDRFPSMWEEFGKMNTHIFDDFEGMFPVMGFSDFTPRRFGQDVTSSTTDLHSFSSSDQVKISNEKDRLEMVFDTTGFDKDELKISRQGRMITVEGKTKSEKSSDESTDSSTKKSSNYVSRQFSRSYTVPSSCNMDKMKSVLSANKKLTISIPKDQAEIENKTTRQVPIEFNGSLSTPSNSRKFEQEKTRNKISEEIANRKTSDQVRTVPVTVTPSNSRKFEQEKARNKISEEITNRKTSDQVRTVPVTVDQKATPSVTKNDIKPQEFEQSKVSECQNRSIHDSMWSPNFIRPILLFNKDDSIFNSSIQSRFGDNLKEMLPWSSNFNREVEIKENNEKELTLKFDLQDYKPNELKVTVLDNVLKVEAKHEENTEGNHISKQFVRSYVLPAEYKAKEVQSSLSKSGTLTVSVPKQNLTEKNIVRDVRIKLE